MAEMGYFFDQPKFTKAEYEGRLAKVRAEMKAKDIEVLILFSAKNFYYLTGYESGATYYQAMIITPTGIVPFLREMEKVIGDTTMTIGAENTVLWQDHWNPTQALADVLKQKGLYDLRIGIEKNAPNFVVHDHEALCKALGRTPLDGSRCVDSARLIKTPQEIAYIRKAAKMTSIGMAAAMESIAEGQCENDLVADLESAMLKAGSESFRNPIVSSGPMSGVAHSMHHRYILKRGDAILLEFSGCWNGYPGPMMRSAAVLEASDQVKKMADACIGGLEAAINTIKPGVTSGKVDEACRLVIENAGFEPWFRKRTGYGLGVFKPSWSEGEVIDLKRDDPRELQAGMVFHMPPALRDPKKCGVGFSESVLVTEHGCEVLTDFPRKLYISKK